MALDDAGVVVIEHRTPLRRFLTWLEVPRDADATYKVSHSEDMAYDTQSDDSCT